MNIEIKSKVLTCSRTGEYLTLYKGTLSGYFKWYITTWKDRRCFRKLGELHKKIWTSLDRPSEF